MINTVFKTIDNFYYYIKDENNCYCINYLMKSFMDPISYDRVGFIETDFIIKENVYTLEQAYEIIKECIKNEIFE